MRERRKRQVKSESFRLPGMNIIDRVISFVDPKRGVDRLRSRFVMAMADAYTGSSRRRRALKEWIVSLGDADTDISGEIDDLRSRSGDLERNNPLARGAINTKVTGVVGTGLRLKANIDRKILNMTDDQADEWEAKTESEFSMWANSTDCDVEDVLKFHQIQELVFRSTLSRGDVFVLTPAKERKERPYNLQLQLIEADRVCNKNNQSDTDLLSGGIEREKYGGKPVKCHILKGHPGNIWSDTSKWDVVEFRGEKTGRRNVLHIFHKTRIGQSRGVPDLAPVIEKLKQLGRYSESELNNAVLSSFFTVFIKTQMPTGPSSLFGSLGPMEPKTDIGGKTSDKDFKMGSGAILELADGEDVEFANPGRPNQAFDHFVLAVSREIGTALELPFEILVKHFTASYSAARAALLEVWKFYMGRRQWLADMLCNPVYELWMTEAVANGRIYAPGFFTGDPIIKKAYLGAEWIGPAKGAIDETKEITAAEKRVNMGISSLDQEAKAITGNDWEKTHKQRVKEVKKRRQDGLEGGSLNQGDDNEIVVPDQQSEEPNG